MIPMNSFQKELSRPPVYNPEDYALSLKKWTTKTIANTNEQHDSVIQTSCAEREMSLRQFSSISDLLNKLKTDLRLAYISFVQEFVADPIDGITLLLELLRTIQSNDTSQNTKAASALHRRSLLDENSCLQCLRYSLRCPETTRRLAMAATGLFSLTVCIMSSVSKSRVIALELLTKICCYSIAGHNAVSEAMSTMRLRYGEPVRFRFLVSMLNGAAPDLLLSGLKFINTFLETSPKKQIHLYIQAELEQAGFNVKTLKDLMSTKDSDNEAIMDEFSRWSKLYIDVEILKNNHNNKCKEVSALKEKIVELESQIRVLQSEKQSLLSESCYKDRRIKLNNSMSDSTSNSIDKSFTFKTHINYPKQGGENSTPAEDEGISSSDQDDSEENVYNSYGLQNNKSSQSKYNYEYDKNSLEPTIDEVMEDFQNVINDVKNLNSRNNSEKIKNEKSSAKNAGLESISRAIIIQEENDIIPSKILPEPPKKSRSLRFLNENIEMNPFFEDESADNSNCSCSSRECSLSMESDHEYSKVEYLHKTESRSNRSAQINNERKGIKTNGLRRSETFHQLQNNKNYIIQNSNNLEKEMKNKKTTINNSTTLNPALYPVKTNSSSYFSNKPNIFPANSSHFTLKTHNNAGLYSGRNHAQNFGNVYGHQVGKVNSNFPKRCANISKEMYYNGYHGKIMDLPSGLY